MAIGMNAAQLAELVAAHENHVLRLIRSVEDLQIRVNQLEEGDLSGLEDRVRSLENRIEDLPGKEIQE